jgi:chromosome segregation ATPase
MSSEPRMRGRRFRRPAQKKSPRRIREKNNAKPYLATEGADPSHLTSNVLNALDHLGNQRFMLPPFSDHYERWLKDLNSLLDEFRTQVPQIVDENLLQEITESMNKIQQILAERIKSENAQVNESTKLQQQLARYDAELTQFEHAHRVQMHDLRKKHEMTTQKIRDEIAQLDRKRIQILRKNTNMFRRFFHKSDNSAAETGVALDSKRAQLRDGEQNLQSDLQKRQEDYAANRQRLITDIDTLRRKIHGTETADDDALGARREACERIHAAIMNASQRTQTKAGSPTPNS